MDFDLGLPVELAAHERVIAGVVRPALQLTAVPVDSGDHLPVLSTKLGGVPDLPPGQAWPVASDGASLQFVLQLNLTDLAARFDGLLPWPAAGGVVQLFTDGDNRGDAVLVHRDLSVLQPARSQAPAVGEHRLDPTATFTFPDDSTDMEPLRELSARLEQESPELQQLLDKWRYWIFAPELQVGGYGTWQQDPGYPEAWLKDHGQWPAEYDFLTYQRSEEGAKAERWQLVFQLVDNNDLQEHFSLLGGYYLVAPHDATGRWDLDRVQLLYQCT